MFFIPALVTGVGKLLEGAVDLLDEALIQQAPKVMQEPLRKKQSVHEHCLSFHLAKSTALGIADLCDQKEEDEFGIVMCHFFVFWTAEEMVKFDQAMRNRAKTENAFSALLVLRKLVKTGQERAKVMYKQMDQAGWGGSK